MSDYYELNPLHTDPKRIKKERDKARELKKSPWWKEKIKQGICHHCGGRYSPQQLTLDHVVPIARGGTSSKNNIVPSCKPCNTGKKLDTPVEQLFKKLEEERLKNNK